MPQPAVTPTIEEIIASPTSEPSLTPTPEIIPSFTPASAVVLESPTATFTLPPPSETFTPSPTPGPYEHVIQQDETLLYIIQLYGYTDLSIGTGGIVDQVVSLNDNIPNADILPPPGSSILIPRQTATPTPGNVATASVIEATTAASSPNVTFPENTGLLEYVVQPNDNVIKIAQDNVLTLAQIARLNPELDFFSCNFEIPSGGPNCNVPLQVGQIINLPAPTPTPTLSPTPSGNETATPTPTLVAPVLLSPPQGAVAEAGVVSLQWVGVGILSAQEYYLVEVTDTTLNSVFRDLTKENRYQLPDNLIPTDGQVHVMNWTVYVVTPNEQGIYRPISGTPEIRSFQWKSR
ncbi:MAG: LysM peptidoglycan-binding domain-containing protein [Anaerolineae bacterium]|nr:LysM peptidoglycan-binding domain-containing protein [Anaerolineae bacterium]